MFVRKNGRARLPLSDSEFSSKSSEDLSGHKLDELSSVQEAMCLIAMTAVIMPIRKDLSKSKSHEDSLK